jgi:hypothetical protein
MTNPQGFKPVDKAQKRIAELLEAFRAGWYARGDLSDKDYVKALKAYRRILRKPE